jgi:hypothetical protein
LTYDAEERADDALFAVFTTPPTTFDGVAALLDYLNSEHGTGTVLSDTLECNGRAADAARNVMRLLATTIRKLAAGGVV